MYTRSHTYPPCLENPWEPGSLTPRDFMHRPQANIHAFQEALWQEFILPAT